MSIETKRDITCPECGEVSEFVVWESLNTSLDPQAKDDLLSGELFRFVCPKCGEERFIDYDLLYHEMDKKAMIYYAVDDQSVEEMMRQFQKMAENQMEMMPGSEEYTQRIVRSQNRLREKAYILDRGLDDRAVEITKVVTAGVLMNENPGLEVAEVFLEMAEGEPEQFSVKLVDGKWGSTAFDRGLYDTIEAEVLERSGAGRNEYFVDTQWAIDWMKME